MLRCVYAVVMLSLIATQNVAKAEDHADLRTSLQACLNGALSAGDFGKVCSLPFSRDGASFARRLCKDNQICRDQT